MLARIVAGDVEPLGLREHSLIPVRRSVAGMQDAVRRDAHSAQLGVDSRATEQALHRARVAQGLVREVVEQRTIIAQQFHLVGVLEEQQHRIAD